jgi:hypothetical protein
LVVPNPQPARRSTGIAILAVALDAVTSTLSMRLRPLPR